MKINVIQTITNVLSLDEERKLIRTSTVESYLLYPDAGKQLYNKVTGIYYPISASCNKKSTIDNFEEVDLPVD